MGIEGLEPSSAKLKVSYSTVKLYTRIAAVGIEPTASSLWGKRSNRLGYAAITSEGTRTLNRWIRNPML